MIKNINELFGEIYTEAEMEIQRDAILNRGFYNGVFLFITSLLMPPLVFVYFIDNTNFGIGFNIFALLLTLVSMVCLLFVSIWYEEYYETEAKNKYYLLNVSDNHLLFDKICEHTNLMQKMKEILEIRPRITQYEYDTLSNLAELLRDQEKNKELLKKINENIG